jgi:hypothetical protein
VTATPLAVKIAADRFAKMDVFRQGEWGSHDIEVYGWTVARQTMVECLARVARFDVVLAAQMRVELDLPEDWRHMLGAAVT